MGSLDWVLGPPCPWSFEAHVPGAEPQLVLLSVQRAGLTLYRRLYVPEEKVSRIESGHYTVRSSWENLDRLHFPKSPWSAVWKNIYETQSSVQI